MDGLSGLASCGGALRKDVLMSSSRVFKELWRFLKQEKKYWLMPIIILLVLFSALLIFAQSSAVGPFIYTLF